jgi:hypothetical protein
MPRKPSKNHQRGRPSRHYSKQEYLDRAHHHQSSSGRRFIPVIKLSQWKESSKRKTVLGYYLPTAIGVRLRARIPCRRDSCMPAFPQIAAERFTSVRTQCAKNKRDERGRRFRRHTCLRDLWFGGPIRFHVARASTRRVRSTRRPGGKQE